MILSATCAASLGLFGKLGLVIDSIPLLISFRFWLSFILLLPFFWFAGIFKKISFLKQFPPQLIRCVCVLLSQYLFFYYLQHSSLLNAILLFSTGPMFIPIFSRIFFKQRIDKITIASIIVSFIGVLCIIKPAGGIIDPKGLLGLSAGVLWAGSQTIYGVYAKREPQGVNLFYLFLLPSLLSIPALFIFPPNLHETTTLFSHSLLLVWFFGMAISAIMNQVFRGFAYQRADAPNLSPFLYFSPVIGALFDWSIFHVIPTWLTLLGFFLIVFASIFKIYLHKRFYQPLE